MKQEGDVLVVACRPMAGVSPVSADSLAQRPFPTPSPFSFSVASSRWSSRPSIDRTSLVLRSVAFVLSFISAALLPSISSKKSDHQTPSNFTRYSELMYCFVVYILVFVYSAFQLFKGICDIAHRGILISDKVSDYYSFILDQLAGYILMSSCSAAILAIRHIGNTALWNATVASTSMAFATFLVIATCCLLSGYKLCKRIIW